MPPKALPPPPRPDPVTLEQIYDHVTSATVSADAKAYHLVALSTVAFHPTVKLFLFEHTPQPTAPSAAAAQESEAERQNRLRRECVLRNIAFLLAQRTSPVYAECRWETVSLLGELCRMEQTNTSASYKRGHAAHPTQPAGPMGGSPQAHLNEKLNTYARLNLVYLAQLPWFAPACQALIGADPASGKSAGGSHGHGEQQQQQQQQQTTASSRNEEDQKVGSSREAIRQRLRAKRAEASAALDAAAPSEERDEDVVIALQDILRALPAVVKPEAKGGVQQKEKEEAVGVEWGKESLQQAHDLMFLDASTSLLHLIPHVTRSSSETCANCGKKGAAAGGATNSNTGEKTSAELFRCSSCKAVYYCSQACQRAHWASAHRAACVAYKTRCATILEQYYAMNARNKRGKDAKKAEVAILEVPLEPTLFFETRRYLYDHRDGSFAEVSFYDYFMKYTAQGIA